MARGTTRAKKETSDKDDGKKKQQTKQAGESLLENKLGKFPLVKFKIVKGKKEIEPWKGQGAEIMEWMRNSSAMLGETREEYCTYWKVEEDAPVYYEDGLVPDRRMNLAYFSSEKDGRTYNLAERLVPRQLTPGNRVRLTILGCCSIMNIDKA